MKGLPGTVFPNATANLQTGDLGEDTPGTKVWGRDFDYATLSRGVRFAPQGQGPLDVSLERRRQGHGHAVEFLREHDPPHFDREIPAAVNDRQHSDLGADFEEVGEHGWL